MHANRQVIVGPLLLLISVAAICGCSSEPKDPFKDWGASTKYREYVPETAQAMTSGRGSLTFTTPADGTLYLVDTSTMVNVKGVSKPKFIASGLVPARTEVTFDPQAKRIHGKGREGVRLPEVDPDHTYELRFEPVERNK
jgi:hypothetical protein